FFTFIDERRDNRPSRVFNENDASYPVCHKPMDDETVLFSLKPEPTADIPAGGKEESASIVSLSGLLLKLQQADNEVTLGELLLTEALHLAKAQRGFLALLNEKANCFTPPYTVLILATKVMRSTRKWCIR
ncbi:MAG: hypothetical protein GXY53_10235, partial [Desulfobulbus sp.]|nr:hypothetical protein [Desulfobulbus sp.]